MLGIRGINLRSFFVFSEPALFLDIHGDFLNSSDYAVAFECPGSLISDSQRGKNTKVKGEGKIQGTDPLNLLSPKGKGLQQFGGHETVAAYLCLSEKKKQLFGQIPDIWRTRSFIAHPSLPRAVEHVHGLPGYWGMGSQVTPQLRAEINSS